MPHRLTKEIHDKLHALAVEAYERELAPILDEIAKQTEAWKNKTLSNAELSERLHQIHQGAMRETFRFYKGLDSDVLVARAIALGFLKNDEIPADIFEMIKPKVSLFKEND